MVTLKSIFLKKAKVFLLSAALFLVATGIQAQSLLRTSMSCFGSSLTESNILLRQTVGQPSNTQKVAGESMLLRQGFQQPIHRTDNLISEMERCTFNVYPNPATSSVRIETEDGEETYQLRITSIDGRIAYHKEGRNAKSIDLDLAEFPAGLYLIEMKNGTTSYCNTKLTILK